MIKSKEGKVKIKGSRPMVMAELSVIFRALIDDDQYNITAEEIEESLERATMPIEDLTKLLIDKFTEAINIMKEDEDDLI